MELRGNYADTKEQTYWELTGGRFETEEEAFQAALDESSKLNGTTDGNSADKGTVLEEKKESTNISETQDQVTDSLSTSIYNIPIAKSHAQ